MCSSHFINNRTSAHSVKGYVTLKIAGTRDMKAKLKISQDVTACPQEGKA